MAKVDTIELTVNGEDYSYNVNVGKAGIFKCKIDWHVADAIGIDNTFEFSKLSDLKSAILIPYYAYLESKKVEELMIWIQYKASGNYTFDDKGHMMFGTHSEYYSGRFSSDISHLAFDFGVLIRETSSTGNVVWYEARKGVGSVHFNERNGRDPDKYYKYRQTYGIKGKVIPYSDKAFDTLTKAREGIRKISSILYGVVSLDEQEIEALLLGGNLLALPVGHDIENSK